MEFLSNNTNREYPQKIFEQNLVSLKKGKEVKDYQRIALVSAHKNSNFTEIKQILDIIMDIYRIKYEIKEIEHGSFIKGRVGRVFIEDKAVAIIGEIHPKVISNFGVNVPVAGLELNLSDLFEIINKEK